MPGSGRLKTMGSTGRRAHLVPPPPSAGVRRGLPAQTGSEGGCSTRRVQDALTRSVSQIVHERDRIVVRSMDAIVNPSLCWTGADSGSTRRCAVPRQTARHSVAPRQSDSCGIGSASSKQLIPKYRRYLRLIVGSPTFWCNRFMAAHEHREQALAGSALRGMRSPSIRSTRGNNDG